MDSLKFNVDSNWFRRIAVLGCGPLHDYMLVMVHLCKASVSKRIIQTENTRQAPLTKPEKKDAEKKFTENYQEEFWQSLQLRISYATPRGGNTNIGQTAHTFFNHPEISSDILGLPRTLISLTGLLLRDLNMVHSFPDIDRLEKEG